MGADAVCSWLGLGRALGLGLEFGLGFEFGLGLGLGVRVLLPMALGSVCV